jgi:hypothetical protein
LGLFVGWGRVIKIIRYVAIIVGEPAPTIFLLDKNSRA